MTQASDVCVCGSRHRRISERAQTLSDTLFGLKRHGEDGWRDQWAAEIQAALDAERLEARYGRMQAEAEKRCEDCSAELVDGGEGVGWHCLLCDVRDKLAEARSALDALERTA